ncbi:MAG TPA: PLP-dependent aspartate aminotransferase family protein [Longimicrobium sp.]|nr:PLP-dependent aspartate aminotransferase family protein [Longimicrobium sp.]
MATEHTGLAPETAVVQSWPGRERGHRTLNVPLYLSSVWEARDLGEMASLFTRDPDRGFYTRFGHPTIRMAEEKLATLEGAEDALLFASGMAAITTSLLAVLRSGDHVVAHRSIFGQTIEFLDLLADRFGVRVSFVDATDPAQVERAMRPETRVVYLESPSNPVIDIQDIRAVSALTRRHGALLFVDSTFAGPLIQRPVELGADLSLQSASKSLAGHADLLAGSAAGAKALIAKIREMRVLIGPTLDPHACFLLLRGMQTLALRVRAQCANAWSVAQLLEASPLVETVRHPFLASHPGSAVARRQMSLGGSMVSFALKGGIESTRRFIDALEWIPLASSLGHLSTTVEVPEELDFAAEELGERTAAFQLPSGLIRVSVGAEAEDDVLREMRRGLAAVEAHLRAAEPAAEGAGAAPVEVAA